MQYRHCLGHGRSLMSCHCGLAADGYLQLGEEHEGNSRCTFTACKVLVCAEDSLLVAHEDGPDDRAVAIVQVAGEELLVQLMSAPIGQCKPLASAGSALRLIPRNAPNLAQVSLRTRHSAEKLLRSLAELNK